MNAQEIFTAAVTAVIKQGKPSRPVTGRCCYRGPDGLKCAVGHLLTDEEAAGLDIGYDTTISILIRAGRIPPHLVPHEELLVDLQEAHDGAGYDEFVTNFRDMAQQVAKYHNLEMHDV